MKEENPKQNPVNNSTNNTAKTETVNTNANAKVVSPAVNTEKIEVLNVEEKKVEEKSKSSASIIVIFGILLLFVFGLPFITSYINGTDTKEEIDTDISNVKEYNTEDGKIKVGEESYLELSDIKFYNFNRSVNNQISFNIIASKKISDVDSKNIYMELYNGKNLLHRTKFEYGALEKSIVKSSNIVLDSDIYLLTNLVKVYELKNNNNLSSYLVCSKTNTTEDITTKETLRFTLLNDMSYSYQYNKTFETMSSSSTNDDLSSKIKEEYDLLDKNLTNLISNENGYSYEVDYSENTQYLIQKDTSSYMIKNKLGQGWNCIDE